MSISVLLQLPLEKKNSTINQYLVKFTVELLFRQLKYVKRLILCTSLNLFCKTMKIFYGNSCRILKSDLPRDIIHTESVTLNTVLRNECKACLWLPLEHFGMSFIKLNLVWRVSKFFYYVKKNTNGKWHISSFQIWNQILPRNCASSIQCLFYITTSYIILKFVIFVWHWQCHVIQ